VIRVRIQNRQNSFPVTGAMKRLIRNSIRTALKCEGYADGEVSVLLCSGEQIRELNRDFRNVDAPTDVLSFPADELDGKRPFFGDMAIYVSRAAEQAQEYGHSLEREVAYLSAHSALHLVGYDHMNEEERAVMREKEEHVMTLIGQERK